MSILGATTVNCNSLLPIGGVPAGASGGGIIQIVTNTKTDTTVQTTAANTWYDISGLSVTITPRSTSNKVFVLASVQMATGGNGGVRLVRGSTTIAIGDASGSRTRMTSAAGDASSIEPVAVPIAFLDNPATTGATTYKLQGLAHVNGGSAGNTFYINIGYGNQTNADYPICASTISVFEISG